MNKEKIRKIAGELIFLGNFQSAAAIVGSCIGVVYFLADRWKSNDIYALYCVGIALFVLHPIGRAINGLGQLLLYSASKDENTAENKEVTKKWTEW